MKHLHKSQVITEAGKVQPDDLANVDAHVVARQDRLTVNTDVYAMADEQQIPTLVELAQLKFGADARDLPFADLSAVIWHSLEWTSPMDKGLREVCVTIYAEQSQEIMGANVSIAYTDWDQLLRKHGDFASRVLEEATRRLSSELNRKSAELESKFTAYEAHTADLTARLEGVTDRAETGLESLKRAENTIDRLFEAWFRPQTCRQCRNTSRHSLERSSSSTSPRWRCDRCRTTHSFEDFWQ